MDYKTTINNLRNWIIKNTFLKQIIIKQNQQSIIQLAKSTRNIALNPVPPVSGNGHIEHYYHFIFDLLLPLSILIKKTPSDVIFSLKEIGILTPFLLKLFDNRVRIQSNFDVLPEEKKVNLIGMNPKTINIHYFQLQNLKELICANLNIVSTDKPNKILLIERLPPNPYYLNSANIKGAGSSRRAIKNHKELEKSIKSKVSPNYEFHNLKLEHMSLEDQIKYFDSAVAVIAQHGAGLANILWMPKNSIVIEFGYNSRAHFKKISASMQHDYFSFENNESHIEINCLEFSNWLSENKITRDIFIGKNTL